MEKDNREAVFRIPPADVVMLPDGVYQISLGTDPRFIQYVSSSHLLDQHINQLERKYREQYSKEQQPYVE